MMNLALCALLWPLLAAAPAAADTVTGVAAGDTLVLELNDALELALSDSYSARVLELSLERAEHDVLAARGRFGTRADLNLALPEWEEGVQRVQVPGDLPRYDSYGNQTFRATLNLNQPLPTDGEVSLSGHVYQQDDSYFDTGSDQTEEQRTFFNSYEVSLRQPLFAPNDLKLGLESAEIGHNLARRAYQRGQLNLSYDVTESFYRLFQAQQERIIARDALAQQQANYDVAQRKFEAGLIPEVEALQMEVDLAGARNDLLARESDLILAQDRFRLLVGIDMSRTVRATTRPVPRLFAVDTALALRHALQHRTEIADLRDEVRRSEITVIETDARNDLKGELSAFYNLTGVSDPALVDPGVDDLIDSSWEDLKRRPGNKGVRFSLSIPIWDSGVNGQEVAAAQVAVRRSQLNQENLQRQIAREVQAALARFEAARRRLEVLEQSRDIARRSYDISLQRFDTGEITSQTLADNRDRLVRARQNYLEAYINYRLASADLRRQTLYDFEQGLSLVEEVGTGS